jgi:hypothetical protein
MLLKLGKSQIVAQGKLQWIGQLVFAGVREPIILLSGNTEKLCFAPIIPLEEKISCERRLILVKLGLRVNKFIVKIKRQFY